jgi:hypothetical protein
LTFGYVLHDMSFANLIMYSAVLPSYHSADEKNRKVIQADDPRNAERVRKILFGANIQQKK